MSGSNDLAWSDICGAHCWKKQNLLSNFKISLAFNHSFGDWGEGPKGVGGGGKVAICQVEPTGFFWT